MAASGCGSKSDVALVVNAENVSLSESSGSFGESFTAGVDVVFDLGHYAGASVHVSGIDLHLFQGTSNVAVVPRATFAPAVTGPQLPATLAPGATTTIHFVASLDQLTSDEQTALCAGPLSVGGTVETDVNGTTTIGSDAIAVTGCP